MTRFKLEIATFANCSKVELLDLSCTPSGCAILSVSDKCQVHLLLKVSDLLLLLFVFKFYSECIYYNINKIFL